MINLLNKTRLLYFTLTILIIILGLISRRIAFIPLFVGDILWATMIFFILKSLLLNKDTKTLVIFSLIICFAVETSQLYQADWINNIRVTLPGRLILGRGFLWTDLMAYIAGVLLAMMIDKWIIGFRTSVK
jgi:hypothetical protein